MVAQSHRAGVKKRNDGAYYVMASIPNGYGRRVTQQVGAVVKRESIAIKNMMKHDKSWVVDYNTGKPIACRGFKDGIQSVINMR